MQHISSNKALSIIAVLSIIGIGIWFTQLHKPLSSQTPHYPVVKTIPSTSAQNNDTVSISGFARGTDRADISPMTSGRILRINKHEGDTVVKGDTIAIIDATQSDAQVAAAKDNLAALKKTVNDSEEYYSQLVDQSKAEPSTDVSDEAVKSAKRARDLQIQNTENQTIAAQGALKIAEANKKNAFVTAPFSGIITTLYGREGGFATFSQPLFSINAKKSLEIETYVTATQARSLSIENTVQLEGIDNTIVPGTITAISFGSDSRSLKTLVRIHVDNTSNVIQLGDFVHGKILLPQPNPIVSIPKNALLSRGGDMIAFTIDENNIAHEHTVITGAEHDNTIDILDGIAEHENVVIEGQYSLINESPTTPYATK